MKTSTLLFLLLFCATAFTQTTKSKVAIDTAYISHTEIVKVNFEKPASSSKKTLSKTQWVNFAAKWNTSKTLGADKYKMTYYVHLHLKNGGKRQFTINGAKVQETDWLTLDIGDQHYFDDLWNNIK